MNAIEPTEGAACPRNERDCALPAADHGSRLEGRSAHHSGSGPRAKRTEGTEKQNEQREQPWPLRTSTA